MPTETKDPDSPPVASTGLLSGAFELADNFACLTGDCPHEDGDDCLQSIAEYVRELAAEALRVESYLKCVVRNCAHIDDTAPKSEPGPMCGPTWHKVGHVLGLGSTWSTQLCKDVGVDPHYDCSEISHYCVICEVKSDDCIWVEDEDGRCAVCPSCAKKRNLKAGAVTYQTDNDKRSDLSTRETA